LALCTVTFGFTLPKKNTFRGNYSRKYGIHNMKNQFWAGLGSRAVLVKKSLGPIMSNF
jgi:hypothetical protein